MAHWARVNENNVVDWVTVGNNNDPDEGYQWLVDNVGGRWIKTSYNGNIRGTFAGIDYSYNEEEDIFVAPQPFPSWIRNGSIWEPPIPKPDNKQFWIWSEEDLNWRLRLTE